MPTHSNIPMKGPPVEIYLWLWASYKDAVRGTGEVTTKQMAGLKLSHEKATGIKGSKNLSSFIPYSNIYILQVPRPSFITLFIACPQPQIEYASDGKLEGKPGQLNGRILCITFSLFPYIRTWICLFGMHSLPSCVFLCACSTLPLGYSFPFVVAPLECSCPPVLLMRLIP